MGVRVGIRLGVLWLLLPVVLGGRPRDLPLPALQDLDRLVEDEQLFMEYFQCLVDLGPCNSDTSVVKDLIREALKHGCERCSEAQRREAVQLLRTVMECRPREYAQIEKQFDPKGTFKNKYNPSVAARNLWL